MEHLDGFGVHVVDDSIDTLIVESMDTAIKQGMLPEEAWELVKAEMAEFLLGAMESKLPNVSALT